MGYSMVNNGKQLLILPFWSVFGRLNCQEIRLSSVDQELNADLFKNTLGPVKQAEELARSTINHLQYPLVN